MSGFSAGHIGSPDGGRIGGLGGDRVGGLGADHMAGLDHDHLGAGRRHFGGGYQDDYGAACPPYDALYSWPCY